MPSIQRKRSETNSGLTRFGSSSFRSRKHFTLQLSPQSNFQPSFYIVASSSAKVFKESSGSWVAIYSATSYPKSPFLYSSVYRYWDPTVHIRAKCIQLNKIVLAMASVNVDTDVVTLSLPLPLLWRLQINKVQKFQLIGLFLLGYMWVVELQPKGTYTDPL